MEARKTRSLRALVLTLLLALLLPAVFMPPAAARAAGPLADGTYTVPVTLTGGTGRANVESPARLTVRDGAATAVIVWSSPNYTFMRVAGTIYYRVNREGNSTFEIPAALDTDLAVSAETVAMSVPHEINYTLRFDSAGLKPFAGTHAAQPSPWLFAGAAVLLAALLAGGWRLAVSRRRRPSDKR